MRPTSFISYISLSAILAISFALILFSQPAMAEDTGPVILSHDIKVSLDIESRGISGADTLELDGAPESLRLFIRSGTSVDSVDIDGVALDFTSREIEKKDTKEVVIDLSGAKVPEDGARLTVRISFHGHFDDIRTARDNIKRGVAIINDGVIGEEGAFLPSNSLWYPQAEGGLAPVRLTVSAPEGFTTVAEGEWVSSKTGDGRTVDTWKTGTPVDGMDMVTARFVHEKDTHGGVDIYTFFFQPDTALSRLYIDKTKAYLDLYNKIIGPYPFRKFAVVESFLPTGYGMPSFTLLGSEVIRLTFIPDTSLGHEIVHNWLGNSVFIDYEAGNWAEALTTYVADYLYDKRAGEEKGRDFRLNKLRGYKNFAGNYPVSLAGFRDSATPASRAVGYSKGVMVFNMLERLLGSEAFTEGLREFYRKNVFRKAAWDDIRTAFEAASGRELGWFFEQWVDRSGGPVLSVETPVARQTDAGYEVSFTVAQQSPPYRLTLPVLFKTGAGDEWKEIEVSTTSDKVTVMLKSRPHSFEVDPGYENFRILSHKEIPSTVAACFGDKTGVIVLPNRSRFQEKYFKAADTLSTDYDLGITYDSNIGMKGYLSDQTIFIFGGPGENLTYPLVYGAISEHVSINDGTVTIDGEGYDWQDSVVVLSVKNPHNPAKSICMFMGGADSQSIKEAARRMRYFAQSSYIVFGKERAPAKGIFTGAKPLGFKFTPGE